MLFDTVLKDSMGKVIRTGAVVGCGVISSMCNPAFANVGTGGFVNTHNHSGRNEFALSGYLNDRRLVIRGYSSNSTSIPTESKTPLDNLNRIRDVFNPSVFDLSRVFGVSRQTIYNWLSGEQPKSSLAARIEDLASAADILAKEGFSTDNFILKRKVSNGKTLLDVFQSGGSAKNSAESLVKILRIEAAQKATISSRFSNRAKAIYDPSEVGLIATNEQA